MLLINNKTGYTKYYEYGRYGDDKGVARSYEIPNAVLENGMPTLNSLNKILKSISTNSGKGQEIEGAYISSDNFDSMNKYAKRRLNDNVNDNRPTYDFLKNNCSTFANDVISQDETISMPNRASPRPTKMGHVLQHKFPKVTYDSKNGTTITKPKKSLEF